jgi:DHA1 family bicyclomycin/chloramphenicol resistance-like MFS transporter
MHKEPNSHPPSTRRGQSQERSPTSAIGLRELVALIAAIMALNALALDQILPALPVLGYALQVTDANDRQWVITTYFLGLGVGSLFYGSLSDRYGRKPVLLITLALFLLATLACMLARSFTVLLIARLAAGLFAASGRVLTVSIVRDRFAGDQMAGITSLIFFSFIIIPIIGPSLGQLILHIAGWRWIFGSVVIIGVPVMLWTMLRLPETLAPRNRVPIHAGDIAAMLRMMAGQRNAMGYILATGIVSGALTGFMLSVQQIFADFFHRAALFPLAFAAMAGFMGLGSYGNSRLVERVGARRLSHIALLAMIALGGLHALTITTGRESLWTFMIFQMVTTLAFAFVVPNFSAMSMAPFARGAGLASSFQTFLTSIMSALLGAAIGAAFDGTPLATSLGFLVLGAAGLILVAWADSWRLLGGIDDTLGTPISDPAPI